MKRLLAALAAIVAVLGVTVVVTSSDDGSGHRTTTVRVALPAQAPQGDLNTPESLNAPTAPATVRENVKNEQALLRPIAPAGAQTYSCRQVYGGHLWSSREGTKPTEFVIHYTAGNGTPASIDSYFRRTRAASATDILSLDGRDCIQEVPLSEKPWTQLAANRYAISVEIVTTGYNLSRDDWLKAGIFQHGTLAALMRDQMRAYGLPLRRVDPVGCNFVPGYTDHNALECGNNHTDVLPNFPWDVLDRQLHDSGAAPKAVSALSRRRCTDLNTIRRHTATYHRRFHLKPVPPIGARQRARAAFLRERLAHWKIACRVGSPGHRGTVARRPG